MQLQLDNLQQGYSSQRVLRGLSLRLESGEIGCLLGPSGCGKTTALRCIAGFESVASGTIQIGERVVSSSGYTEPPERRQIGMVFQEAALLPHLTALGNVAFGLHRLPVATRAGRAAEYLQLVGLAGAGSQYPHELSGGQQQRVALARALAPGPELILLDEPFANLDSALRERLGREVRLILKQAGVTALLVTHDQMEAFMMADKVGLMRQGQLAQWATPYALYHEPVDRDVAAFVGHGVFLGGTVVSPDELEVAGTTIRGKIEGGYHPGDRVDVMLRPDDVELDPQGISARVIHRAFRGATVLYTLALDDGAEIFAELTADNNFDEGAVLQVRLNPVHLVLFRSGA